MTRPPSQRDMIRELYRRCGGDEERTIAAYAAAERRGQVQRRSNTHDIDPEDYASRLLADCAMRPLGCRPWRSYGKFFPD